MKLSKRILLFLLAAITVLSLVACNNSKPADDQDKGTQSSEVTTAKPNDKKELTEEEYNNLFNAAIEKITVPEFKGIDASFDIKATIKLDKTTTFTLPLKMAIAASVTEDFINEMYLSVEALENEYATSKTFYYDGTKMYEDDGTQKYFYEVDPSTMSIQTILSDIIPEIDPDNEAVMQQFEEKLKEEMPSLVTVQYTNPSENVYVSAATVDGKEYLAKVIAILSEVSGEEIPEEYSQMISQITFDKIEMTYILDNNTNSMSCNMNIALNLGEELASQIGASMQLENLRSCSLELQGNIIINRLGQTVEITPPDDLDTYTDSDDLVLENNCYFDCYNNLFDENGEPVADYEEQYQALVEIYGQELVDEVIQDLTSVT